MILVTRISACIDVVRLSMVYYRTVNTALFFKSLAKGVSVLEILPLVIIAFLPTIWYLITVLFLEKELRKRAHKLLIGFCINKIISYFISVTIFTKVAKNLGSQGMLRSVYSRRQRECCIRTSGMELTRSIAWGMSGVTATSKVAATTLNATAALQSVEKVEQSNEPNDFNVL
jgi:chitin synthase